MRNHLLRTTPFLLLGGSLLSLGCGMEETPAASAQAFGDEPFIHRSELINPKEVPAFTLTDQNGEVVKSEDLAGKVALVGFVYTNCPDICRAITATYLDMQDVFAQEVGDDELELILITTDPARDTPDQAKDYTDAFGGRWSFLTGTEEELEAVWSSFHVSVDQHVSAIKSQHTWMVVLVDRDSKLRIRYVGQDVPKDVLSADVRAMLNN